MMTTEFKLKDALAVAGKEGEARGVKKLLALWERGVPLAEAKRRLGIYAK